LIQNIDNTPKEPYYKEHYYCDYVEILALINNKDIVSISDIYDRFKESIDMQENNDLQIDENPNDPPINENSDDKWRNRIQEWFDNIASRNVAFNNFYPFVVKDNNIQLKNPLTDCHKLYIFLLLSASQKYINTTGNTLSEDFEKVSLVALKNYLPNNAISHIFGTKSDRYIGTLEDKITRLAGDLKYRIKTNDFKSNNTGDAGLDLVAWLSFSNDDNQNNMQIFLAQCATGKQWGNKQHETKKITNHYIDFKSEANYTFFMPYDCRNADRNFAEENIIFDGLFFDRIRILYLLKNEIDKIMNFASFNSIVDYAISYEEEIV